jgi:hypothetical protein
MPQRIADLLRELHRRAPACGGRADITGSITPIGRAHGIRSRERGSSRRIAIRRCVSGFLPNHRQCRANIPHCSEPPDRPSTIRYAVADSPARNRGCNSVHCKGAS